jgi:hypothetical protein
MIDTCESIIINDELMERCNPFSMFYIMEIYRKEKALSEIFQYQAPAYNYLRQRFFTARALIKKMWLDNPCFLFFGHVDPSDVEDQDWHDTAVWFIEAISDHFVFLRAIQVEYNANFKKFFANRTKLLTSSFDERVQLLLIRDQE